MKGIYFVNEKISLSGLSEKDSIHLQKSSLTAFIQSRQIQVIKLNPYQINDYYTILHALLYDLKKQKSRLDCLIVYSQQVIEDYILSYPARWLILKSFFHEVIMLDKHAGQLQI